MNNLTQKRLRWSGLFLSVIAMGACSSGGGSDTTVNPPPVTPPPDVQKGIEGVGIVKSFGSNLESITVSDVTYDATSSTLAVTIDDQPAALADLSVGNVVRVTATTDDDGITSVASSLSQINDLEGPIEAGSIDTAAGTFVVLGQTVQVVATTLFDDSISPSSIEGLADGDDVEVSGLLDGTGVFVATRIEDDDDAGDFEVTGIVSGLDTTAMRFTLNALVVDYSGAILEDFNSGSPADGDLVEVYGAMLGANGELIAQRVENETPSFSGDDGDFGEIEGFITRFGSQTDFDVEGFAVTTTANTVYEDGSVADLALGVRVDVDGALDANGVLVATEIDFEDADDDSRIEVAATVEAVDQAAGTLAVLGLTIGVTPTTVFEDDSDMDLSGFGLADINVGDFVEMVLVARVAGLEAIVIERDDPEAESELRGPVDMINEPQLTVLGVTVETTNATDFELINEVPVSASEFFNAISVGVTVKIDGLWNGTALVADEAELED